MPRCVRVRDTTSLRVCVCARVCAAPIRSVFGPDTETPGPGQPGETSAFSCGTQNRSRRSQTKNIAPAPEGTAALRVRTAGRTAGLVCLDGVDRTNGVNKLSSACRMNTGAIRLILNSARLGSSTCTWGVLWSVVAQLAAQPWPPVRIAFFAPSANASM